MPSRLLSAVPPGVRISRVPLDGAIDRVRDRLAADAEEIARCEA
jgi:ATP-dependent DNA helicase DinG